MHVLRTGGEATVDARTGANGFCCTRCFLPARCGAGRSARREWELRLGSPGGPPWVGPNDGRWPRRAARARPERGAIVSLAWCAASSDWPHHGAPPEGTRTYSRDPSSSPACRRMPACLPACLPAGTPTTACRSGGPGRLPGLAPPGGGELSGSLTVGAPWPAAGLHELRTTTDRRTRRAAPAASRFEPAFPFPFFLSLPSPVHTCLLTWPVTSVGWVVQRVNLPSPFLPMDDGALDAQLTLSLR